MRTKNIPPPITTVASIGPRLFNHLVRPLQERRRDRQAESLGDLEVDHEFERSGLLDRQIGGLGAPENLVDVASGPPLHLGNIHSVGHEAAWLNKHLELIDCGDPMRGRKIDDCLSMQEHEGRRGHEDTLIVILLHAEEGGSQIPRSAHNERMNLYAEVSSRGRDLLIEPIEYLGERRGCDILAKDRDLRKIRYNRFEKLEALRNEIIVQEL